uniref:Peptidase S1 domain-containing protein n=1 Tax=Erpetoichthys calabaricus TaxID=27687 RepID=A0A8C4TQ52_ERPCA
CGTPPAVTPRILNGQASQPGRWPWQVSLRYGGTHICGGSVITNSWVLTAAQCVLLGMHVLQGENPGMVRSRVRRLIPHEKYNKSTMENNIALIELEQPVPYGHLIQPVCLPKSGHTFQLNGTCYVSGWGGPRTLTTFSEPLSTPTVLRQAAVDLISSEQCDCINGLPGSFKTNRTRVLPGMICSWISGGSEGSCVGDAGGPLVCNENDTWFLAGVSSFNDACMSANRPTVYTEVTGFSEWIPANT